MKGHDTFALMAWIQVHRRHTIALVQYRMELQVYSENPLGIYAFGIRGKYMKITVPRFEMIVSKFKRIVVQAILSIEFLFRVKKNKLIESR